MKKLKPSENNTIQGWVDHAPEPLSILKPLGKIPTVNVHKEKPDDDYNFAESGTAFYFLPEYIEHSEVKDSDGYPLTLDLGAKVKATGSKHGVKLGGDVWIGALLEKLTGLKGPENMTRVVGSTYGGWIIESGFVGMNGGQNEKI